MFLWRISRFSDLTGKGGEVVSGRWHEKGNPIVYCADHPSTALLEMIVHVNPANIPETYQLLKIELPGDGLNSGATGFEKPRKLSETEQSTVKMLQAGIAESQMAENLGLSENTVRHFLSGALSRQEVINDIVLDDFVQGMLQMRMRDRDFTQRFGMRWLNQNQSCTLKVPSAVMPAATNYLLNPRHPDAGNVRIVEIFEYPFDKRLK
jgi:RES domain-containing protein